MEQKSKSNKKKYKSHKTFAKKIIKIKIILHNMDKKNVA